MTEFFDPTAPKLNNHSAKNLSSTDNHHIIFFSNHPKFNIVRSEFNKLAKVNISFVDLSDNLSLQSINTKNLTITISDEEIIKKNSICISKSYNPSYDNNFGWQRHLNQNSGEGYSLGHLRGLGKNMEPLFRIGEDFTFNLNAIRKSDLPNHKYSSPTGFTIEEACQIARYIGTSTNLRSFNIYCCQDNITNNMAESIAIILWYFLEGLTTPKNHPRSSKDFTEFIVQDVAHTYVFLQSNLNGKWWLSFEGHHYPCSYDEYISITEGKIPTRLLEILE